MKSQLSRPIGNWRLLAVLLLLGLTVTACRPNPQSEPVQLSGPVLLWHDMAAEEALVLEQVLTSFIDVHPDVRVKTVAIPSSELRQRYEVAVASGLGPDLLLGPSSWIKPLADQNHIQPIDDLVEPDFWTQYVPAAIAATQYDGHYYAIPESLRMMGLYYNKNLVEKPPVTLAELMDQVAQGNKVGMSADFVDMFWGIGAFGGELEDEDGRIVLNRGGFANWLVWLTNAQEGPNFLIDRNRQTLRTLFGNRELAYLVDGSWAAKELQTLVGENTLGVAPLPSGPIGPASPLLETNAFMLSVASSHRQTELAINLAQFITNPEQATTLMRRGDRISASNRVQINPSVDPIAYPFISQARNAIPFQNSSTMDTVIEIGSGAYSRALQGVEEPIEVANNVSAAINQALNIPTANSSTSKCQDIGVLEIWHALDENDAQILRAMADDFQDQCPYALVRLTGYTPEKLYDSLTAADTARLPDIALIPSQWLVSLVESKSVRSLTGVIPAETLQAYQPAAVQSWIAGERLFGVPLFLDPPALYFNKRLVTDPARTLDDLLSEGVAGRPTAINIAFGQAYWGMAAFGGKLFDADNRVVLDEGEFVEWLQWLQEARNGAGAVLGTDADELLNLFLNQEVAYFISGPDALAPLEANLGQENFGVTRLPTGPVAEASPLLTSSGFILPSDTSDEARTLALRFIERATDVESQKRLMEAGRKVPINIAVYDSADPSILAFLERANSVVLYPNSPEMAVVETFASNVYDGLLSEPPLSETALEAMVREITEQINVANGFPPSQPVDEGVEADP